ncbi:MAG: methylated-DNA--[protein]-cysteine S-methyltransferase [Actinomycetota bacterium]|nr:methylated-DNA--[protein]-cysteine S-methyltransferase [Actinomycetota bacterium]
MRSVRYFVQPSPLGELLIGVSRDGICLIHWGDPAAALEHLHLAFEDVRRVAPIPSVESQLDEYFAKERRSFTLPLDLTMASPFGRRVLSELNRVPFGELTTYGALAERVHSFPRAVGGAVGRNPIPIVIPCHRVVAAGGAIGGFSGGLERKHFLLGLEGHPVQSNDDKVRLAL